MENSRTRAAARTRRRLATFTTAMPTTSRAMPIMMVSGIRASSRKGEKPLAPSSRLRCALSMNSWMLLGRLIDKQGDFGAAQREVELIDRGFRLGAGDAGAQPACQVDPVSMAIFDIVPFGLHGALHGDGHIDVRQAAPHDAVEARRRDADDGERSAVDEQRPAFDGRLGKMRFPVIEIENGNRVGAFRGLVAGHEEAAESGPHAQHLEVVAGDHFRGDRFGMIVPDHADAGRRGGDQAAQNRVAVAQVAVHGIGEFVLVAGSVSAFGVVVAGGIAGEAQHDELAGVLHGKSAQQRLAEHG